MGKFEATGRIERCEGYCNGKAHDFHLIVDICESKCFQYGNRKAMGIKGRVGKNEFHEGYDIRYDTRYSSKDEKGYVERFICESLWSGEENGYKVVKLDVKGVD